MQTREKDAESNLYGQTIKRLSYEEYGISKSRLLELQNGCKSGLYSHEMLSDACNEFSSIRQWILLSVVECKSFDTLEIKRELGEMERVPICRTDFYSCRRRFYYNLDRALRERATVDE